jgi:uncharacterized protein YqjF (DUF2071 family)
VKPFLTAEWRDLVMLNYSVEPGILRPLVPRGTKLDLWQDRALVSVVGFRFVSTRVLGLRFPGHESFEEVNLRFYVRRRVGHEVRRAVVFIRELVPRFAIAWTARAWYNEPYRALPMRHRISDAEGERRLSYEWCEHGAWAGIQASTVGPPVAPVPGSEAEFITEHYWGYTSQRNGGTVEYQVQHAPWRVWEARSARCAGDLTRTYGATFADAFADAPLSAFVAEGSAVTVFRPRHLTAAELSADIG